MKSATFPNVNHSAIRAADAAMQRTKTQHVTDEQRCSPGIQFWREQQRKGQELKFAEEAMQPGTPTSVCTNEASWEQHPDTTFSLRMSHCKPLRITRQDSGSEASTSRTDNMSTPCSPKASPKIMVVCRICEEQAGHLAIAH